MSTQTLRNWQKKIERGLDFRPEEGVYRLARTLFTDRELFDLEMELIFEKQWIFACHESQIPQPHDFITLQAGRQPMIITRDGKGELHALSNTCQHRGTTLTRVGHGNQSTFTCPFHAWCYKSDGKLAKVKGPAEYGSDFDKQQLGLKPARIASYRGFVFISLDTESTLGLTDFLGDAALFFDLMVEQSATGELEVLPGISSYSYPAN
ncbi:Rieske 2Fe-2S domain-containing protein [Erwinia sp. E602]|uniref:Rieske 2Fe-2S domain-containing protein n=1 Tax=Erwinia sp. E602 TaxID=2675378 RepID=UPI002012A4BB|nr:Rieske 2Fe-2S domain-containing protein [Erwinia sp. E602]